MSGHNATRSDSPLEELGSHSLFRSSRFRFVSVVASYLLAVAVIVSAMLFGYQSQIELRLDERTREIAVAYETVISTLAAAPELFYSQIAVDETVTRLMQEANNASEEDLARLNRELLGYLEGDYETLQRQDFRQLHFHLRDNRSLLRFHRPDTFGDDLTDARPTIRLTNTDLVPTYAFEEGRIYNGFRYVFPMFHQGDHVGSVEVSMNYRAIVSRIRLSRPAVFDFVMYRQVVEDLVFEGELDNYEISCFSERFLRETASRAPDTTEILGVDFGCLLEDVRRSRNLVKRLESFTAETMPFSVNGATMAISALPIRNLSGDPVAYIFGFTRFEESSMLRRLFGFMGLAMILLTSAAFFLYLRIAEAHKRVLKLSVSLHQTIQEKDRFFSIVSHDLRGPVGSLASLASILREDLQSIDGVPVNLNEIAEVVAEGAANSSQLLNDLLDWARSQRGDVSYKPGQHDLSEVVDQQFAISRHSATEKSIALENNTGDTSVYADDYMLRTIIRNLVSNSIKFTPEGGSVTISAAQDPAGTTISVTDTGVGMTEQQQRDVLDLTVKSSTKGTRAEPGTGLGLKVCQEFVRKHGGS
ncbi:MAG: hypothetical protein EA383_18025, partial [Spirochaetaceae bacterium]